MILLTKSLRETLHLGHLHEELDFIFREIMQETARSLIPYIYDFLVSQGYSGNERYNWTSLMALSHKIEANDREVLQKD